ncbi:uncharacterized protein LOC106664049 [Cimex lectularius]|uniref:Uncharacterized protein n=1 Tax=Cimex lectularius TaxID=79782 RepID=A0A8I6SMY0_CIMLE|nr:uncharacterized protein LOC106664049 [Cimex lectularius]
MDRNHGVERFVAETFQLVVKRNVEVIVDSLINGVARSFDIGLDGLDIGQIDGTSQFRSGLKPDNHDSGVFGEKVLDEGCDAPWSAEIFRSSEMPFKNPVVIPSPSREDCIRLCVSNTHIHCRAANYYYERKECAMSDMDRFAVSDELQLQTGKNGVDYIESNCATSSKGLCHFSEMGSKSLSVADSIHKNVKSLDKCKQICLETTSFQCRSYEYRKSEGICRLSHSSAYQQDLKSARNEEGVDSFHMTACYNVSVYCGSNAMVAKIKSNKLFRGKIYAKSRPNSCVNDIASDTDFQLEMGFNDLGCEVSQESSGKYSSNIIIQHHDQIVTEKDMGLSIKCSYTVTNRSIQHGVNLDVRGEPNIMGTHESSFVLSPTVTMHITDRNGDDILTAQVGDPLSLRFRILDANTPYEIFVRELIAFDGVDSSEILLIDSMGCPTDPTIMGTISTVSKEGESQVLEAPFDAFKFPTSDIVQFKALVTPCLPTCEPVSCTMEDYFGSSKTVASFGRRKREVKSHMEEEVVMQSIRIQDKFKFSRLSDDFEDQNDDSVLPNPCKYNNSSLLFLFCLVLSTQLLFWVMCYAIFIKWKRKDQWNSNH